MHAAMTRNAKERAAARKKRRKRRKLQLKKTRKKTQRQLKHNASGSERHIPLRRDFFYLFLLVLPISHHTTATISTIRIIAVQKPALKIPPITSHELAVKRIIINTANTGKFSFFMICV